MEIKIEAPQGTGKGLIANDLISSLAKIRGRKNLKISEYSMIGGYTTGFTAIAADVVVVSDIDSRWKWEYLLKNLTKIKKDLVVISIIHSDLIGE